MRGRMQSVIVLVLLVCTLAISATEPWMNVEDDAATRAQQLLKRMSQAEKLAMVHGYPSGYVGSVDANKRLNIPQITLEDGPQGVADGVREVTAWPSVLTAVSSWDRKLLWEYGVAQAEEQYVKGTNVLLGPMVNIARVPTGGRNFESFGEDPHLASELVKEEIRGIQSQHVIACAKHFAVNNQEYNRTTVSAFVSERALYELYYPAFQAAIDAGVGSFMCSYNLINGTYACENHQALTVDLKETMGFRGWVMSDWGATHSTAKAANAGLDQEMPDSKYFGSPLAQAVYSGQVTTARLDDMVTRILTSMFAVGLFDYPTPGNLQLNATSVQHNLLARQIAEQSTVLLKNDDGALPLNPDLLHNIAVIGDENTVTGGGSGGVIPPYIITPYQGILTRTRTRAPHCTFEQDIDYYQEGSPSVSAQTAQECCAACSAQSWCNYFTFTPGTCWLKETNTGRVAHQGLVSGSCGPVGGPNVTYNSGKDVAAAVAAAKAADVAIVVVATTSKEGSDRATLSLGEAQDALVAAVAGVQPKTIVVLRQPGAVLMPWVSKVPAIVAQFMPGQEAGNALASVLFGDVNPSGKLPISFPNTDDDTWLTSDKQYPGVDNQEWYTEELLVGYRWYDSKKRNPLFPFGHGLSYSKFTFHYMRVNGTEVSFSVENTGTYPGAEVAQLYVGFPESAGEPPLLLRGFEKVFLLPGETREVKFVLDDQALSVWNVKTHSWQRIHGTFQLYAGRSSRDFGLHLSVEM